MINIVSRSSLPIQGLESSDPISSLNHELFSLGSTRGQHILVLGASNRLGSRVVRKALDASYRVTILVQNDHKLPFTQQQLRNPNLVVCLGSIFSLSDLDKVIEGQDAVINCLSPRKSWSRLECSLTQRLINDSMSKLGVKRLIVVRFHKTSTVDSFFARLFANKDKDKQIRDKTIVENSEDLDWTIIKVGEGPKNENLIKRHLLKEKLKKHKAAGRVKISKADVVNAVLREVELSKFIRKAPSITARY
ncbi:hypothetical protein G9A89_006319 [Geosiphon pyriformis]|nr:hypothetical protein G9A89_006319 [Geosiphon pyriformis]